MADFPKKQQQCLIPKYLLDYTTELNKSHPDPTDPWGGSGGDVNIEAGTGITITTESDDTKVISLDTNPDTFEVTADTGMTLEVENQNPLYKDSKLQMSYTGATRLEGTQISLEANNIYLNSDHAPYYVNNTTHEYKTLATTDQLFSGDYDDLYNKPTIPDAVSGTNDGTNWTSLTIGEDTYGLASGGSTYTAGTGIDITNDTISVDTSTVAMKTDLPDVTHMVTDNTNQDITGAKTFKGEDKVVLQGTSASQKPGFAVLDYNDDKRGFLELRPGSGDKTMVLGVYNKNNYTDTSTYRVGFREYNQNYSNYTYSTLMPKGSDKYSKFGSGNMNMVLGVNGQKADDSGNVSISIPTKTSDLNNDSGFITGINSSDVITALGYTPGTSNFSGSYTDLTDKPTIPTATSQLTNDSGFITNSDQNVEYIFITSTSSTPQPFTLTNDQIDAIVLNPTKYIIVYDYQPTLGEPRIYFRYQYQNGTYFSYASLDYYKDEINSSSVYGYRYRKCQFTLTVSGANKGTITMTNANQDYQKMLTTGTGISMSNNEISVNTNTIATRTWVGNQGYLTSSDISNMVTTDTSQNITASKTFTGNANIYVQSGATYTASDTMITNRMVSANQIDGTSVHGNEFVVPDVTTAGNGQIRVRDFASTPFVDYRIEVPKKNGTMALTSDIVTSYNDLTNKPDLSIYAQSANLATVATSGSYNDLTNKPTIPTVVDTVTDGNMNPVTSNAVYDIVGDIETLLAAI